jgi:hypothetical protein
MSHSKLSLAVLSVLVLGSAPLMAAMSSDVELRLAGAQEKEGRYLVKEGDFVQLTAVAAAGHETWVILAPAKRDGGIDWASASIILAERDSGFCQAVFEIPKGNSGQTFALLAFARDRRGEESHSNLMMVEVL